jgi:nickel transport protein
LKRILALFLLALLLCAGSASAHRMFVGQRITMDLYVFFDDGSPAANARVKLYQGDELFAENVTDATGKFTVVLPGKGTGNWRYEVSGGGHSEKGFVNIDNSEPVKAAAMGMAILGPLVLISRMRRKKEELR